jgi:hypothetical protein
MKHNIKRLIKPCAGIKRDTVAVSSIQEEKSMNPTSSYIIINSIDEIARKIAPGSYKAVLLNGEPHIATNISGKGAAFPALICDASTDKKIRDAYRLLEEKEKAKN